MCERRIFFPTPSTEEEAASMPGQGQHKNTNANNCHPNSDDTKGSNKTLQEVQQTHAIESVVTAIYISCKLSGVAQLTPSV